MSQVFNENSMSALAERANDFIARIIAGEVEPKGISFCGIDFEDNNEKSCMSATLHTDGRLVIGMSSTCILEGGAECFKKHKVQILQNQIAATNAELDALK